MVPERELDSIDDCLIFVKNKAPTKGLFFTALFCQFGPILGWVD